MRSAAFLRFATPAAGRKRLTYLCGPFDPLSLHRYYSVCVDDRKRSPELRAASFTPHPGDDAFGCAPSAFIVGRLAAPDQNKNTTVRVRHRADRRRARTVFRQILFGRDGLYFV